MEVIKEENKIYLKNEDGKVVAEAFFVKENNAKIIASFSYANRWLEKNE